MSYPDALHDLLTDAEQQVTALKQEKSLLEQKLKELNRLLAYSKHIADEYERDFIEVDTRKA